MKHTLSTFCASAAVALTLALGATAVQANHYYGVDPDAPVDHINGVLATNGSVAAVLAAGPGQPNENHDFVVFSANAGDVITILLTSNQDSGLSILADLDADGIHIGDALGLNIGLLFIDDDSGGGVNSLITFTAGYTGQYLAGIAEIAGREMSWELTMRGSTASDVPEPGTLALVALGVAGAVARRRRV